MWRRRSRRQTLIRRPCAYRNRSFLIGARRRSSRFSRLRSFFYSRQEPGQRRPYLRQPELAHVHPQSPLGELDVDTEHQLHCFTGSYAARPEPGEETKRDFVVCPRLRLRGEVRSESGAPLPGAQVFVRLDSAKVPREECDDDFWCPFPTDETGRYDTTPLLVMRRRRTLRTG